MPLFKYCSESGKYIIKNLEIKIAPPNELNDPCEFRPMITNSDPKAWAEKFLDRALLDRAYYETEAQTLASGMSFTEFQKKATPRRGELILALVKESKSMDRSLQNEVSDMMSAKWGIVSLSANPISQLMWSHYADSHRGMMFEFNETDQLFKTPSFLKCEYKNEAAIYDSSGTPSAKNVAEFVRRKRSEWAYEEESRLIIPFEVCRESELGGKPLWLYKLNPSMIVSVTFGQRTEDDLKREVEQSLSRSEFSHVTKWEIREGQTPIEIERVQVA